MNGVYLFLCDVCVYVNIYIYIYICIYTHDRHGNIESKLAIYSDVYMYSLWSIAYCLLFATGCILHRHIHMGNYNNVGVGNYVPNMPPNSKASAKYVYVHGKTNIYV